MLPRASLEELRLDYEDFLRQRGLAPIGPEPAGPKALQGKALRHAAEGGAHVGWMMAKRMRVRTSADKQGQTQTDTDEHGPFCERSQRLALSVTPVSVRASP